MFFSKLPYSEIEDFSQKSYEPLGKLAPPIKSRTFTSLLLMSFLVLAILAGRLFYLQVIQSSHLQALAWQARTRIEYLPAPRGIVYDRFHKPLVENQTHYSLVVVPALLPRQGRILEGSLRVLSSLIKEDISRLREKLQDIPWFSYEPQVIKADLTQEEFLLLETRITELQGFQLKKQFRRVYPKGEVFAHILGYLGYSSDAGKTGRENQSTLLTQGKQGIERTYEDYVQGVPGQQEIEISSTGEKKRERLITQPQAGKDVVLTIDSGLQEKLYQALISALQKSSAQGAAAIALDPRNGAVRALVSLPSFDNNIFSKALTPEEYRAYTEGRNQPFFNRAISGQYPPGSTIKPLIAVAGLEQGLVTPEFKIFDKGQIRVPSRYNPRIIYTFKDWKAHGWVDLRKALAISCNVYFYILGGGYQERPGLGISRINKYLRLFGLGEKLGLDLPGEARGLLPTPFWKKQSKHEAWYLGDTYHVAIGQGDLEVTPLQVASYTGALANGGTLFRPHILQEVVGEKSFNPQIIRQNFVNSKTISVVKSGMRQAVTAGLLRNLADLPVAVAGKTGTAQVGNGKIHSWVTVFAPYENPQLVLTVLLEKAVKGGSITASVAKEVLLWYFEKDVKI